MTKRICNKKHNRMWRKTKEFTYNYVDRVRLAENSLQDHKCPTRGSGWRHNKSISHLDLATSCPSAAAGLNHWSHTHQLRHSRSLDYNHSDRCQEALDIAGFYWHIDPEAENYEDATERSKPGLSHNDDNYYRDYSYADGNYRNYHSTNSIYQHQSPLTGLGPPLQAYDFGSESCSLRRSRSLAVIREETFSDLQITSANNSRRRSQLIPRARLVNRGFFRERERLIYSNNNKHHHHHFIAREKLTGGVEQEAHSSGNSAATCDSHQQQHEQQQQQHRHHHHHHENHYQSREADDYYENLKRLDALAVGIAEQLHPWHNDKSDLESLNSEYFKHSLHQSQEQKQQQLDLEALEEAVNLLTSEKPRIYQSNRQPRAPAERLNSTQQKLQAAIAAVDSCPENSQSSAFPETTTSNSDDQTDSASLSEQEYDLTKIEEIFQRTQIEGDEEGYELISLTTTTRTRIETTEDEEDEHQRQRQRRLHIAQPEDANEHTTTDTEVEINIDTDTFKDARTSGGNREKLIAYDSVYLSSEEGSDGTLIEESSEAFDEARIVESNSQDTQLETSTLLHICIEDTVYKPHKSGVQNEQAITEQVEARALHRAPKHERCVPAASVLKRVNTKIQISEQKSRNEAPLYTQVVKVLHTPTNSTSTAAVVGVTSSAASRPNILSVVEKRKLKRYSDSTLTTNIAESQAHDPAAHTQHALDKPYAPLKRQATDSFYAPVKVNAIDNQYHSLPDISIGQSLNVSECIDAKLRSSYNVHNYQRVADEPEQEQRHDGVVERKTTTVLLESQQREHTVTTEQIYDSIRRFGRAHQQARQKEYQQLNAAVAQKQAEDETKVSETAAYLPVEEEKEQQQIHSEAQAEHVATAELTTTALSDNQASLAEAIEVDDLIKTHTLTDTDGYQEQPKEAPAEELTNFSRQIKRRAKEVRANAEHNQRVAHCQQSTTYTSATYRINKSRQQSNAAVAPNPGSAKQFRIIVTDTQNNIIEEDSIDEASQSKNSEHKQQSINLSAQLEATQHVEATEKNKDSESCVLEVCQQRQREPRTAAPNSHCKVATLKRIPSKRKRQQQQQQLQQQPQNTCQHQRPNNNSIDGNYSESASKSKERRVLSAQIYRARPIKVLNTCDSLRRRGSSNSGGGSARGKMSRPQILHVVDNNNKRKALSQELAASGALINSAQTEDKQVENEYLKKVDAVRCYWSKLAKDEQPEGADGGAEPALPSVDKPKVAAAESDRQLQQNIAERETEIEPRHFHLGAQHASNKMGTAASELPTKRQQEDFCSFMPSIEIVELTGEKMATIVSAVPVDADEGDTLSNDASEPQFDHIRYKVLKSQQLIRSNILARNKKEAQFDGLIQYLQEYSFQELLSNNNVVIVEPVRTKIERPLTTTAAVAFASAGKSAQGCSTSSAATTSHTNHTATGCTMTARSGVTATGKHAGGGGIKRHFFYQPVRVNRELYEEELPDPDTVRNVRKFFEEHILPTPGRGLLLRKHSEEQQLMAGKTPEAINAVTVQLSPKSRRARKYRYLTIDTSYGHAAAASAAQQQSNQQPQLHSRKWDTASISSGISSGDLSSPCECNELKEEEALANSKKLNNANATIEMKGVHVQDVVRRHNNKNSTASVHEEAGATSRYARPRSSVYEPSGDSTYYRDIYECAAGQNYCAANEADENIDDDDDDELYADDDDDELCESYYVSNDVLEKIRECGSTVTYYGGRVVGSSPDALCGSNNGHAHPHSQSSTGTLTKARAREFETCSVCQPHECPAKQQLEHKFQQVHPSERNKASAAAAAAAAAALVEANNAARNQLKFKLIKSNSCSSRLELAGAGDVEIVQGKHNSDREAEAESSSEVVRKMVHHFESNKKSAERDSENCLTINSQTPVKPPADRNATLSDTTKQAVTVNNHINMPDVTTEMAQSLQHTHAQDVEREVGHLQRTFQSAAMNIRLDTSGGVAGDDAGGNNTKKVCRNKNVDLAYTMAKQQQQQQQQQKTKSTAITEGAMVAHTAGLVQTDGHNTHAAAQQPTKDSVEREAVVPAKTLESTATVRNADARTITAVTSKKSTENWPAEGEQAYATKIQTNSSTMPPTTIATTTTTTTTKPTQIVVPVEIHRVDTARRQQPPSQQLQEEKPCLSTTSSMASLVDKAVVRHYVANDKSLFEKRKYDDIEFEEFEVYDPTKDFEKLIESVEQEQGNSDDGNTAGNKPTHSQQLHKVVPSTNDKILSVSDLSALNDGSTNGADGVSIKLESDTDCYDSLNEKL